MLRARIWLIALALGASLDVRAQPKAPSASVESNVVYGMYSGLALLMDVHRPAKPNGYGILFVAGSGFTAPLAYDAPPLKQDRQMEIYGSRLVDAGYTVFAVNLRLAPRFRYPAAIEDLQRAVRYVRYHATRFGINPDRIGAMGGSDQSLERQGANRSGSRGVLRFAERPEQPRHGQFSRHDPVGWTVTAITNDDGIPDVP